MQKYHLISNEEIERIHENSLKILEEVGVIFSYKPAREVFEKHGAKVEGKTVFLPRKMVEDALALCPSSFTLHARNPQKTVEINTTDIVYAGPYGAAFVQDLDKGRRISTMEDYINFAKLTQMLDNIDVQSHIYCEACDIDDKIRHMEMHYSALKYCEKPVMGGVLGYQAAKDCIEMTAIVQGGMDVIRKNPANICLCCTLTPLSYDDKMAGAIMAYAECGQPQLVSSLSMAGATTPVTIAGTVALQNAEVLAGIVLAQLINPGTPIVYSASTSNADMRMGNLAIGSIENAMFSLINGQLAKRYNLPVRMSGALSDSKIVDAQAGYESMLTLLMAEMGGGNFILHAAGILESYNTVSFEKLILDDELIGMVRHLHRGVTVDENSLAFDVIKEVGPRGAFIGHEHTFHNFRKEFYQPKLSDRDEPGTWASKGSLTAEQRANLRWKQLLENYQEPALPADVDRELRKYIESKK